MFRSILLMVLAIHGGQSYVLSPPEFLSNTVNANWTTTNIQQIQEALQAVYTTEAFYDLEYRGNCWCSTRPPFFYNHSILMISEDPHDPYTYADQIADYGPSNNQYWQDHVPSAGPSDDNPYPYLLGYKYYGPLIVVTAGFNATVPVCNTPCAATVDYTAAHRNDTTSCTACTRFMYPTDNTTLYFLTTPAVQQTVDAMADTNTCPPCGASCNLRTDYRECTGTCQYCTNGFMNACATPTLDPTYCSSNCTFQIPTSDFTYYRVCSSVNVTAANFRPVITNPNTAWARVLGTYDNSCYDLVNAQSGGDHTTLQFGHGNTGITSRVVATTADLLQYIDTGMNTKYINFTANETVANALVSPFTPYQYYANVFSRRVQTWSGLLNEVLGCALDPTTWSEHQTPQNTTSTANAYAFYKLCPPTFDVSACLLTGGCPVYTTFLTDDCTCADDAWCHNETSTTATAAIHDRLLNTPAQAVEVVYTVDTRPQLLRQDTDEATISAAYNAYFFAELVYVALEVNMMLIYNECTADRRNCAVHPLVANGECQRFDVYNSIVLPGLRWYYIPGLYNDAAYASSMCPPALPFLQNVTLTELPGTYMQTCVRSITQPGSSPDLNAGGVSQQCLSDYSATPTSDPLPCPYEAPVCMNASTDGSQSSKPVLGYCTSRCNTSAACPSGFQCLGISVATAVADTYELMAGYCSQTIGPPYYTATLNGANGTVLFFEDERCSVPAANCQWNVSLEDNVTYTNTLQRFGCASSGALRVAVDQQPNLHGISADECTAMASTVENLQCVFRPPRCDSVWLNVATPTAVYGYSLPSPVAFYGAYTYPTTTSKISGFLVGTAVVEKFLWMQLYLYPLLWNQVYPAARVDFDYWEFSLNWTHAAQSLNSFDKPCGFSLCGVFMPRFMPSGDGGFLYYENVVYASNQSVVYPNNTDVTAMLMYYSVVSAGAYEQAGPLPPILWSGTISECYLNACYYPGNEGAGGLVGCTDVRTGYAAYVPGCYACAPGLYEPPTQAFSVPPVTSPPTVRPAAGISRGANGSLVGFVLGCVIVVFLVLNVIELIDQTRRRRHRLADEHVPLLTKYNLD